MEGMNLEIMEMIERLQDLKQYRETNGYDKAEKDRYGYSWEPLEMFSAEPLNFTETGMRLYTESLELFNMLGRANHHSPLFYKMSGLMEKLVGQMGSCCITKAVLETQGNEFDLLDDLEIDLLRRITAYNFRKVWASFMESRSVNRFNEKALDLSIRWAAMDKRLLATEEKIKKIKSGEIKIDTAVKNTASETKKQTEAAPEKEAPARPFDPQARAFPVDKAAVREAQAQTAGTQAEGTAAAEPEVSDEVSSASDEQAEMTEILPEAESVPRDAPAYQETPVFDSDPEDEEDPEGDDPDEDSPEVWPFPVRSDFLFTPDRAVYRVDRSNIPFLIHANAPPE